MSYTRKQLEALGEPFGDSATALKPGGRVYGSGGGGGGPSTTTQVAELPDWAKGYAQEGLAKAQAVTSQPYTAYEGPRIAGFSPLQIQAQQGIAGLGPAGQIGEATNLARGIGSAAQGTSYDPGTFTGGVFNTGAANQYMSPFMEAAMEPQLREAQRTSAIQATQQAGQAVQSGAFGGGRAAILEAERQRNLGTQLGDIRARGYQTAFEQAQNQFNQDQQRRMQAAQLGEQSRQFGAGLGLQGLGVGLQAAGQLGQLGQLGFGQTKDVLNLQRQAGAEQQALRQQGLTQAYQDFTNEQNYPYKQLGFMSDLIRGLPLGQQTTRQMYEGQPSMLQTIGSLGMGAYGLKQLGLFAEGGSVTDERFVESALDKMSDQQLAQAERVAIMRNDKERLAMIAEEKAMRASERRGLAAGFNQMPQQTQQQMLQAARGGIVAFEEGGDVEEEADSRSGSFSLAPEFYAARSDMGGFTPMTAEERQSAIRAAQAQEAEMRGASPFSPFIQDLVKQREALGSRREENKGLIALAAAQALSKGSGLRRGLGEMFGAIGATAASVNKDLRDSERLIKQSELALAQAEEARKNMQFDKAAALVDRSEATAAAAAQRRQQADLKKAEIASREREAQRGREAADTRVGKQIEAQLEAARIQASRPGETAQAMGTATKAFVASGLPESEAQLKAVELVLGRSSVTDWSRARDDKLNAALAADPTLKDDPVRLAQARAAAGTQAASDLRGFAQRAEAASGKEDIDRLRAMMTDLRYLQAVSRAGNDDPRISARGKRELEDLKKEFGIGAPAAPAAGSQAFPTPNAAAISALKSGLGTREQFDAMFGPGAAAKVLGK